MSDLVLTTTVGGNFALLTQDGQTVDVSAQPESATVPIVDREWDESAPITAVVGSTIVASTTVSCLVTGALQVVISGTAKNINAETPATLRVAVSHGATATPTDYAQAEIDVPAETSVQFALVVTLDQLSPPVLAPTDGTPFQVNAVLVVTGQAITVAAHGVQLSVQEQFN
jgi:hypothetical protein